MKQPRFMNGQTVIYLGIMYTIKDCFQFGSKFEYRFVDREGFFKEENITV